MKILFDQNLSHRLVSMLADTFSDAAHLRNFDMTRADDEAIWEFAKSGGFTIVSKDDDFHQRSFLYGHPHKVVWLRLGNCSGLPPNRLQRCCGPASMTSLPLRLILKRRFSCFLDAAGVVFVGYGFGGVGLE